MLLSTIQAKLRIISEPAQAKESKAFLHSSSSPVAAPGLSADSDLCRSVFPRTDGPVPAKVSLSAGTSLQA